VQKPNCSCTVVIEFCVLFIHTSFLLDSLILKKPFFSPQFHKGVAAREGRDVFFLKHLHHARAIRNRVLECFERASNPTMTAAQRSALCSFVVVGGGATSCEFATELSDFLRDDVSRWYPELAKHHTSITIVEAGPRILGTFDAALVDYYEKHLRSRNISLRLDTAIKAVEDNPTAAAASASEAIPATTASVGNGERAELPGSTPIDNGSGGLASLSDGSSLPFGCLVWSAGLAPVKFVEQLPPSSTSASRSLPKGFGRNGAGRLVVDQYLRLPGTGGRVFSAGDCAVEPARECPMTANTAEQQGAYLAKCFNQYYKHRPGNTLRIVGENGLQKKGQAPSEQGTALGGSFCPGLVCDPPGPVIPSGMPFDLLEPLNALLFSPSAEFRYVERGKMVSMGLGKGIADLSNSQLLGDTIGPLPGGSGNAGPATLKGWAAFVSWRAAYLSKQLSWGNRLLVPMFWFKSWAFGRDISRF